MKEYFLYCRQCKSRWWRSGNRRAWGNLAQMMMMMIMMYLPMFTCHNWHCWSECVGWDFGSNPLDTGWNGKVPGWIESTQKFHREHLSICPRGNYKSISTLVSKYSSHCHPFNCYHFQTQLHPNLFNQLDPTWLPPPSPPGQLQNHHQIVLSI